MPDNDDARASYTLIRDLPQSDRPRERLRDSGAAALSSAELLAILLRVGGSKESALAQAQRLLRDFRDLPGVARAGFVELCNQPGIGEAKAAQIKAAFELGRRLKDESVMADGRPVVRSPEDIANVLMAEMSPLEQEHVRVLALDARSHVIGSPTVYIGSVHTAHVRIGELLSDALKVRAAAIVVVHNHPSGDPTPSAADIQMTKSLLEAAKLMDLDLHDHIVIGGGRYVSLRSMGLGFPRDGQ